MELISILKLKYLLVVADREAPALIKVCTTIGWPYKEAQWTAVSPPSLPPELTCGNHQLSFWLPKNLFDHLTTGVQVCPSFYQPLHSLQVAVWWSRHQGCDAKPVTLTILSAMTGAFYIIFVLSYLSVFTICLLPICLIHVSSLSVYTCLWPQCLLLSPAGSRPEQSFLVLPPSLGEGNPRCHR